MTVRSSIWTLLVLALLAEGCKTVRTGGTASKLPAAYRSNLDTTVASGPPRIQLPALPESAPMRLRTTPSPAVLYKDVLTVAGVGDIMMGTNFPDPGYLPPTGFNPLVHVQDWLREADVTFGNLEGVLLNSGGEPKKCKNPDLCYLFRSPSYMAQYLRQAGFDLMSLANNHAGDFGNTGRISTMQTLDSVGIRYAGLESCPYAVFESEGIRYGLAAFAPNSGTISIHDTAQARALVQHLDSISHIVIVSFHGGAEGKEHQHITKEREFFYGEDRGNVHEFSHMLVDAGADIIFGHGPHVTRAIDVYKQRFIAYSLGNFCTYARFNLRGPNGIAPILKISTKRDGTFIRGKILPVRQTGLGVPEPDLDSTAIIKIRELTTSDFSDLTIDIDPLGNINYLDLDF